MLLNLREMDGIRNQFIIFSYDIVTCQLSWRVLTVSELQGNSHDIEALHTYILAGSDRDGGCTTG